MASGDDGWSLDLRVHVEAETDVVAREVAARLEDAVRPYAPRLERFEVVPYWKIRGEFALVWRLLDGVPEPDCKRALAGAAEAIGVGWSVREAPEITERILDASRGKFFEPSVRWAHFEAFAR